METNALVDLVDVFVTRQGNPILQGVTWQIQRGENWVLLGPNGSGKTTLMSLCVGSLLPDAGEVKVFGHSPSEFGSQDLNTRIGLSGQKMREQFAAGDTVLEIILASAWGQAARFAETYEEVDYQRAQDLLYAFGLDELADRPFGMLSEGEQQLASLARSLMADPEMLILDEPTSGLDLGSRELLVTALQEIMGDSRAPGVLMITHELEDIAPSFTHAALLKNGQIAAAGPIESVLTSEILSPVFEVKLSVTRENGRWWAKAGA